MAHDRRLELVLALERLAARDGHLDAPVAEIARSAGLTPGLVHYYFPRKLDLVLAMVEHLTEQLEARLEGRRDLASLVDACLGRGPGEDEGAVRCWVATGAAAASEPEVKRAWVAAMRRLGAALGGELGDDPALASGALALVLGYWQIGAVDPGAVPRGTAAETTLRLLRGAP